MRWRRNSGTCRIEGCAGHAKTRGWCNKHYLRWLRNGDAEKMIHPNYKRK